MLAVALSLLPLTGCGKPQAANIALRKENQALKTEVEQLRLQRKVDQTTRPSPSAGAPPVPMDLLFTTHGLKFGRLTAAQGNTLRVFVVPTDQTGGILKAAGGFSITAFDLAKGPNAQVGTWTFTPEQAAAAWNGSGMLYTYVLELPLSAAPSEPRELTVRVEFTELLTGRTLTGTTTAKSIP